MAASPQHSTFEVLIRGVCHLGPRGPCPCHGPCPGSGCCWLRQSHERGPGARVLSLSSLLREAGGIPVRTTDVLGGQNTEQMPRVAGGSPRATLARRWPQIAWPDPAPHPHRCRAGERRSAGTAPAAGAAPALSPPKAALKARPATGRVRACVGVCSCAGPPASVHVYVGACACVSTQVCASVRACVRPPVRLSASLAGLAFQEVASPVCACRITGFRRPPWHTCPV